MTVKFCSQWIFSAQKHQSLSESWIVLHPTSIYAHSRRTSYLLRQTKFQRYHFHRYDPFTPSERGAKAKKIKEQANELKEIITSIKENFRFRSM